MKTNAIFLVFFLFYHLAYAQNSGIFRGDTQKTVNLEDSLSSVPPGSIVLVGENHALRLHQSQQLQIMEFLRSRGLKVAVGLEFFSYPYQNLLEQYRSGLISESDFLSQIQWGGFSFDYYRPQALFPRADEGAATLALNAPRALTGKVSKAGLSSLDEKELKLLPPQFSLGRESYKVRFLEYMGAHLPNAGAGERYFTAQSIWDDTMAWVATEYIKAHPDQVLVIIVGQFHVQFGGGLPDRIRSRAPHLVLKSFVQVNSNGLSDDEIQKEIQPSLRDGIRADYLWVEPAESPALLNLN